MEILGSAADSIFFFSYKCEDEDLKIIIYYVIKN